MTESATTQLTDVDFTERRDWGIRFLVLGFLAAWLLTFALGSTGVGGGDEPGWSATVHVMREVQGAVVGLVALAWLVMQWQRHDPVFVRRVRRLVLGVAWGLVLGAVVAGYLTVRLSESALGPPVAIFPLEIVVTRQD
ncbi:hypothetical protein [Agrococcus jenensis]|uniref:Uncharacterized protein n=1 Tax=Agrococcus jenensis TaxID=46353 RepID=A0A3N2AUS0_9MICO|nr:hypothetical protein [Agrococcus jenensis]ROR66710.1 hypothetical protein EDD26_2104 [Agrococcus jenensis]